MSTPSIAAAWFAQRGWQPFPFQQEVWRAVAQGESGLLHATTGSGKTYAVWLAALQAFAGSPTVARSRAVSPPLNVLWLTPMRALAADTERALRQPVAELDLPWSIALRTGFPAW